jgi:hypothetical protein
LPCCIEGNQDVSVGRCFDAGVIDRCCKQASAGMKSRIVVPDQGCRSRIKGTLRWNRGDGGLMRGGVRPLHLELAVMRSVAAAADRQIRIRAGGECKQRRHQRKAEEQQQRECQNASHTAIVADGQCSIGMSALI